MELRQLRYFIAVVEAQSITRAARKMHVVQSALSHQLANLEAELQAELLLRSNTGVQVTEAGRVFYRHAQSVIKQVDSIAQSVHAVDQEIRGSVAIGIPNSTAAVLALPLLKAVRCELPHVELAVVEGLSGLLAEQLGIGALDLAILFDTAPTRGFEHVALLKERLHFVSVSAQAHQLYSREAAIDLSEVVKWPLVLAPKTNGIRVLLEHEALRAGLTLNIVADIGGLHTMLGAVECGLASSVAMAVNAATLAPRENLLILPLRNPAIERSAGLYQQQQLSLSPAARAVKEITLRLVGSMIAEGKWPGAMSWPQQ